ncbi:MAG: hypothetical protein HUJ84_06675, partial [Veillonella sp.]|nr:hypothetical protein [Veillonella sp.]
SQKLKAVETQAVKADSTFASTVATKETDAEPKGEGLQTSPVADGYGSVSIHEGTPEAMTMVLSPVDGAVKEEPALDLAEVTQPLAGLSTMAGNEDATAPTLILRRDELNAALANQELMESAPVQETEAVTDYSVSPWKLASQEQERVNIALEPFMHSFGVISTRTREVVEEVTRDALQELGLTSNEEVRALLDNIVVQEALLYMQKAYAANPTEWMRPIAVDAFVDVVTQPKSSTPYLVAFDALKILSNLTLAHLQVMAITLLLQYSRNSNNYSLEHFRHYVDKYIQPFVSDLPRGEEVFRQLDYLRCTQDESEKITLMQLLSNSYSFVFNFRGFTKDELYRVLDGEEMDSRFLVKSLNSALYKLALVDEA